MTLDIIEENVTPESKYTIKKILSLYPSCPRSYCGFDFSHRALITVTDQANT